VGRRDSGALGHCGNEPFGRRTMMSSLSNDYLNIM
jgi:hypothetical protein